jgi:YD repeat-containing protein
MLNGKKNGIEKVYSHGRVLFTIPYTNGEINGIQKKYYQHDGKDIIMETPYVNNKRNGLQKAFYVMSGRIICETQFVDDKENGIEKVYRESRKLLMVYQYTNGKKNGIAKGYHENGNLMSEIPYTNNMKHGIVKHYYPNGQLEEELAYVNDVLNGVGKNYYENGTLKEECTYKNGWRFLQKAYYENGNLKEEIVYTDDRHFSKTAYYESGKLKIKNIQKDSSHWYFESGKIMKINYVNQSLERMSLEYNENGKLISETTYIDHGDYSTPSVKKYNENGNVILYDRGGLMLIDNHNYKKDTVISFGHKIDKLLRTELRSKNRIKKLAIQNFGSDYDTTWAREGQYKYAKNGIEIIPNYGEKFDFMEIDLLTRNSKEVINSYPIQKLTAQDVITLFGKPYQINPGDRGLDYFIYLTGKTKIIFSFYFVNDGCNKTPYCNEMVEKINIYYNKNGANL